MIATIRLTRPDRLEHFRESSEKLGGIKTKITRKLAIDNSWSLVEILTDSGDVISERRSTDIGWLDLGDLP